jgi:hypothetical protein
MNERIKQLAKEAAREMNETGTYSEPKFQEKFAELIVKECADIGERYADGNYEVRNQIMVQFGLEEPEE